MSVRVGAVRGLPCACSPRLAVKLADGHDSVRSTISRTHGHGFESMHRMLPSKRRGVQYDELKKDEG